MLHTVGRKDAVEPEWRCKRASRYFTNTQSNLSVISGSEWYTQVCTHTFFLAVHSIPIYQPKSHWIILESIPNFSSVSYLVVHPPHHQLLHHRVYGAYLLWDMYFRNLFCYYMFVEILITSQQQSINKMLWQKKRNKSACLPTCMSTCVSFARLPTCLFIRQSTYLSAS